MKRYYVCIDLKSFYASCECISRGLDPLTTNLLVADNSRGDGTICLAVSPSLKKIGVSSRPRLYEAKASISQYEFRTKSKVDYIIATPRMSYYIDVSSRIYECYLKYISPDDIHVYSIDEVFIDITEYTSFYNKTPHELATLLVKEVIKRTGITATCGIGTNMYLAKICMDITAKHKEADSDGVRIAELDEMSFRLELWDHEPLSDFWQIASRTQRKLNTIGLYTMGDIARQSLQDDTILYKLFGIDAEIMIDHAWGIESCLMSDIKAYKTKTGSLSRGQVLPRAYSLTEARLILKEMAELLAYDMKIRNVLTASVSIYISDNEFYCIKGSHDLGAYTNSVEKIRDGALHIFDTHTSTCSFMPRRLNISANNTTNKTNTGIQLDMFHDISSDYKEGLDNESEDKIAKALIEIRNRHGNNAIIKGMSLQEGSTLIERNESIGGHKA